MFYEQPFLHSFLHLLNSSYEDYEEGRSKMSQTKTAVETYEITLEPSGKALQ